MASNMRSYSASAFDGMERRFHRLEKDLLRIERLLRDIEKRLALLESGPKE